MLVEAMNYHLHYLYSRGIQKVLRQILKNTLFMKFTKLFDNKKNCAQTSYFSMETSLTEVL